MNKLKIKDIDKERLILIQNASKINKEREKQLKKEEK